MTDKNTLHYKITTAFRDIDFHTDLGHFQTQIRSQQFQIIEIDFSDCEWSDPLPLVYLISELAFCKANFPQQKIFIDFGEYGTSDSFKRQRRFRKFANSHGFIEALCSHCSPEIHFDPVGGAKKLLYMHQDSTTSETFSYYDFSKILKNDRIELAFDQANLFQCQLFLFSLKKTSPFPAVEIDRFINELITSVDKTYFFQRPSARSSRDTTLQRLRNSVQELIRNAYEHAYQTFEKQGYETGVVGVFGRLRLPHHNDHSHHFGHESHATRHSESTQCPEITPIQERHAVAQAELFVCDVGKGIASDLPAWAKNGELPNEFINQIREQTTESTRYPLKFLQRHLFVSPLSRYVRGINTIEGNKRGQLTGLQYLGHILSFHRDIARISYQNEWISCTFHDPKKSLSHSANSQWNAAPTGTRYQIAIAVSETPPLAKETWIDTATAFDGQIRTIVETAIRVDDPNLPFQFLPKNPQYDVVDLRSDDAVDRLDTPEKIDGFTKYPIIRTPRNFEKNRVFEYLETWFHSEKKHMSVLVFADMSRFQALILDYILCKFTRRLDSDPQTLNVTRNKTLFLITEDLVCKEYKLEQDLIGSRTNFTLTNVLATKELKKLRSPVVLVDVLKRLRMRDSDEFWQEIEHLERNIPEVLLGPVRWTDQITLPKYLDFSLALHERKIARITRRALRRLISLYPDTNALPIDALIEPELYDAQKWLSNRQPTSTKKQVVLVGSVRVTGETEQRQILLSNSEVKAVITIFAAETNKKPDAGVSNIPRFQAMLWKKADSTRGQKLTYARLPGTPFVINELDSKMTLARIVNDVRLVGTTPNQMYAEFQSDGLIKLGHWVYGKRHSLIDINVANALDNSLDSKCKEGFYAWAIESILSSGKKSIVIGYPVNRLAATITRTLEFQLSLLTHDKNISWLPLHFLQSPGGALLKLAPATEDRLKHIVLKNEKSPTSENLGFIFVDIGAVSNRTFRHTTRQLKSHGIDDVKALVLQNRTNWPATANETTEDDQHPGPRAYWRWGYPVFNSENTCGICNSLSKFVVLAEHIEKFERIVGPLHSELREIKHHWRPHDMADEWFDHGLPSENMPSIMQKKLGFISLIDYEKIEDREAVKTRFELTQENEGKKNLWHYVHHVNSTSFVAHILELAIGSHRATYPLEVLQPKPHATATGTPISDTVAVELLIATILQIGNEISKNLLIDYVTALVEKLFAISKRAASVRITSLMRLTIIALLALDAHTKKMLAATVVLQLEKNSLRGNVLLSLAIAAVSCDTEEGGGVNQHYKKLIGSRIKATPDDAFLTDNAYCSGLLVGSRSRALLALIRHFARGLSHKCDVAVAIQKAARTPDEISYTIQHARSFIQQFELVGFTDTALDYGITETVIDEFRNHVNGVSNNGGNLLDDYRFITTSARTKFWEKLVRIDDKSHIFNVLHNAGCNFSGIDVLNSNEYFRASDSILLCDKTVSLLDELKNNACQHGNELSVDYRPSLEAVVTNNRLELNYKNLYKQGDEESLIASLKARLKTPFIEEVGGEILFPKSGYSIEDSGNKIFHVQIFIPFLSHFESIFGVQQ